jgi:hypothetical protein
VYQWKVNGLIVGSAASNYSYVPANGDVVKVKLISNALCAVPDSAIASRTMSVNNLVVPTVGVSAAPGTTITAGQSVTFTATVSNGGPAPTYQWLLNGTLIAGATNATYTSTTLANGDIVNCQVYSSGPCGNQPASAFVIMTVGDHTGVTNLTVGSNLMVVPNPSNGNFKLEGTVSLTSGTEVTLELTDMAGRIVYTKIVALNANSLNENLQLSKNIASGVYLLNVKAAALHQVFRVAIGH